MKARTRILGACFALLVGGACLGDEAGKVAAVDAAIATFNGEVDAFREKMAAASAEERREMMAQAPDAGPAIAKAAAFIKDAPGDAAVPRLAGWVLTHREFSDGRPAVYKALLEHHLDSAELGEACMAAIYERGEDAKEFLETAYQKADAAQAKAAAAYVLSYRARRGGDDGKRAEYLRFVVENAGDLEFRGRSISAAAEGELFAAENLSIGKVAPDIEGEDTEGVAFKLSDYRGKVVVIDFWGDW